MEGQACIWLGALAAISFRDVVTPLSASVFLLPKHTTHGKGNKAPTPNKTQCFANGPIPGMPGYLLSLIILYLTVCCVNLSFFDRVFVLLRLQVLY